MTENNSAIPGRLYFHLKLDTAQNLLNSFDSRNQSIIIVASCQFSPDPKISERFVAYHFDNNRLLSEYDCWLNKEERDKIPDLAKGKYEICSANCDGMYSTAIKYLWFEYNNEFYLFYKTYLQVKIGNNKLLFFNKKGDVKREIIIENDDIIKCFLSQNWIKRGVEYIKNSKKKLLAFQKDYIAIIDPTYDRINLMFETTWLTELGYAISKFTGLSFEMDNDLK